MGLELTPGVSLLVFLDRAFGLVHEFPPLFVAGAVEIPLGALITEWLGQVALWVLDLY